MQAGILHAADDPGLLVGGHAHGAANIRALSDLGLGNFVWIPKQGYGMGNTPWDERHGIAQDVEACVALNLSFMISQRRGLGEKFKPGGAQFGGDTTPDIHSAATVRSIRRRAGRLFVGLHSEELDADLVQSGLRASSRSRVPHLYSFETRQDGRESFERELRRIGGIYHGYAPGVRYLPNLCVSLHHSGFRAGGDIVMAELLESLPATELQLAFMRGGARQWDRPWGVWVSPWHRGKVPTEDKTLWPGPNSAIGEGHDASRFRRCLYQSWVSGARVLTMQETEPLFSGDGAGGYRLAAWGSELKSFWDYVKNHRERVEPIPALALMIGSDCGWTPAHLHGDWIDHPTLWGKLPVERADVMLSQYLDALLPGFERTKGWWKEGGYEYPGYFASTPAGPFDIVSSDIPPARLACYPAVALMGEIQMTPGLLSSLKEYVRGGGLLLINVNQMRSKERFVQDRAFLGAAIGQSRRWSDWSGSDLLMRQVAGSALIRRTSPIEGVEGDQWQEEWFVSQDVQPEGARVLAANSEGLPVLLENRFGSGRVWLSTPDFLLTDAWTSGKRLNFFADLLRSLGRRSEVRVTQPESDRPQQDISWIASHQGGDLLVLVSNHGNQARDVWVTLVSAEGAVVEKGRAARPVSGGVELTVDAEDIAMLRVRRTRH